MSFTCFATVTKRPRGIIYLIYNTTIFYPPEYKNIAVLLYFIKEYLLRQMHAIKMRFPERNISYVVIRMSEAVILLTV